MDKTPGYWHWVYYITREWDFPDAREAAKVIGFAIIMSTFGKNGRSIRPAAHTIARRAGMTDKLARHYRQRCVELGLFTDTGRKYNCIPVLDVAIPGKPEPTETGPRAFNCSEPGCNVPVWHEHRTEEPTAQERRAAYDEPW